MSERRLFVVVIDEVPFLPDCLEPRRPRVFGRGIGTRVEELFFPLPSSPSPCRRSFFFGLGLLLAAWLGFAFVGAEIEDAMLRNQFDRMFRTLHVIELAGEFQPLRGRMEPD